ncbi:hypothetical protein L7H23_01305 [Sphingopyxis sp. BSN-002]|uniref:hypothetical protein n=1 Tax=Sphingopyxis sp. BSN-002 TaxID=2911495 RepID=UPI001EDA21B2|nr:hypothetical protein [Sphingopyxis sp. BSN-002]UKK84770.1 hypothetical protein L7H23_01305 [Sphingopyxis sp. BSN-002]
MGDLEALLRERAEKYGLLRRSSVTAIALDRAADELSSLRERVKRIEKFATEWGVLIAGGRYGDVIYGLHTGDAREAELRHSDLCALLALLTPESDNV